jgi:hypothetical protein
MWIKGNVQEKDQYLLWFVTGEIAENSRYLTPIQSLLPELDRTNKYEVRICPHTKKLHVTPANGLNIRDCSCRFRSRIIGVLKCS